MKRLFLLFILLFLYHSIFGIEWQTNVFKASDEIVKNPQSGLCFMPFINETADKMPEWLLKSNSIVYIRPDWADVMDKSGNYIFDELDEKIYSTYRKNGLRLAFRIMPANIHSDKKMYSPKILWIREFHTQKKYLFTEQNRKNLFFGMTIILENTNGSFKNLVNT